MAMILSQHLFFYVCLLIVLSLWISEISEEEAEDHLQEAIQEKFAAFGDVCFITTVLSNISFILGFGGIILCCMFT